VNSAPIGGVQVTGKKRSQVGERVGINENMASR